MTVKIRLQKSLLHVLLLTGAIVMLYPLLWMLSGSLKPAEHIFADRSLWSDQFMLDNYVKGWQGIAGIPFYIFFKNSFLLSAISIIGNVVSCSMAAYAFARLEFPWKKLFFIAMLGTMMLPYHVLIIPQYIIFNQLGWVNTFLPLTLPKFLATEGFFIFLMVQFMRSLPSELDKAATVDGCGPVQIYWRLVLPLSLPVIVTTVIFTFIWTWNDFFSQLLYLNDAKNYTISLGLRLFLDSTSQSQWGSMFAMSTLSLVPIFLVFLFFQRYIIEGITAGGLKG
ncbi:carbohydrate ABC transporter permease [Cohnella hongkongensis]|uniref:Carbohydrate ABC transporter permease n=1 Tax=Cohnella hongkongensis TaxID=178337 RepID=A0ABV9F6T7_9BACL